MVCKLYRWEPSCVLYIADMCKDISMTSEELEFLIQKILRYMYICIIFLYLLLILNSCSKSYEDT